MRISTQFCYQGWGTGVHITCENSRHLARVERRGEAEVNSRRIWNKLHYCIRNIFYFLVDTFTGIGNQELVGKVENFMFYIDSNVTGQITLRVVHWLQPASKHYLHFIGRGKRNNLIWPPPPPRPLLCYNFGQDDKNDNNNDILSSANIGSASGKLGLGLNHWKVISAQLSGSDQHSHWISNHLFLPR